MIEAHDPEMPGRMAAQLMNVAVSFMILHWLEHGEFKLTEKHRKIVETISLDSITKLKMKVMVELAKYEIIQTAALATKMAFPTSTIRRALEDLNALNIVSREKATGRGDSWMFKPAYRELMNKYMGIKYEGGTLEEATIEAEDIPPPEEGKVEETETGPMPF